MSVSDFFEFWFWAGNFSVTFGYFPLLLFAVSQAYEDDEACGGYDEPEVTAGTNS